MNAITNITNTARMLRSVAWTLLSAISGGRPVAGLVLAAAGLAWFAGTWAIISSFF